MAFAVRQGTCNRKNLSGCQVTIEDLGLIDRTAKILEGIRRTMSDPKIIRGLRRDGSCRNRCRIDEYGAGLGGQRLGNTVIVDADVSRCLVVCESDMLLNSRDYDRGSCSNGVINTSCVLEIDIEIAGRTNRDPEMRSEIGAVVPFRDRLLCRDAGRIYPRIDGDARAGAHIDLRSGPTYDMHVAGPVKEERGPYFAGGVSSDTVERSNIVYTGDIVGIALSGIPRHHTGGRRDARLRRVLVLFIGRRGCAHAEDP